MTENIVRYGVKNVHFSPITVVNGVDTYAKPIPFPGAVSLSIEPNGETNNFRADNLNYYTSVSNNGYNGTYGVAEIPIEFRTQILGDVLDENGILTENASTRPTRFALMYEFDGDKKATRHVIYNCTATRPTDGSETTGETIEPNTSELTFVASPVVATGITKRRTSSATTDEIYNAWYDEVYNPTVAPAPTPEPPTEG